MNWPRTPSSKKSAYARDFQQEDAHKRFTLESLSAWVKDSAAREHYLGAFRRPDFEAMRLLQTELPTSTPPGSPSSVIKLQARILQIHGLQDPFLLPGGLNSTWEWLENDWTLLTIRQAGHFVQSAAADLVTCIIVNLACLLI